MKMIGQTPIQRSQWDDVEFDYNDQPPHPAVAHSAAGQREGQTGHPWSIRVTISVDQRPHRPHHGLFVLENKDMAWRLGNSRGNV